MGKVVAMSMRRLATVVMAMGKVMAMPMRQVVAMEMKMVMADDDGGLR